LENIMLFVSASDLSTSEMALLGNNIRPGRRRRYPNPQERANRRVLAAVNRSLSALRERVDRLHPIPAKGRATHLAVAS
jgi:hypothetical protein